ncbi:MAG: hypothetical protein ACLFP4_15330 [Spirochaetales bacterium]
MNPFEEVKEQVEEIPFKKSTAIAIVGGGGAALIALTVFFGLQRVFQELSFYQLLAAMQRSSTTLCFAGITSASTIMPLMLTIFSFAKNSSRDFSQSFYRRIKWIALFCVIAFFSGLITLTLLSSPVENVGNVDPVWFQVIYYSVVTGLSIMVGILVAIIIMLYHAIRYIINRLNPHRLRGLKEEREEKEQQEQDKEQEEEEAASRRSSDEHSS